jgi:hypothetical protein
MNPKKSSRIVDPLFERSPEMFSHEPRTIPPAWDLSEFFDEPLKAPKAGSSQEQMLADETDESLA